jgi:hypothetical protein
MKKIFSLIFVIVLVFSCGPEQNSEERKFDGLAKPLVVIAKHEYSVWAIGSIVVKDKNNNTWTFTSSTALGLALVNSYEKGDTIK